MGNVQNVLVVHPSVNAKSVAELVALAKRAPGQMTFGSGGSGSQAHIGVELLKAATSTYIVHIPYKGVADMLRDLIGGQLSMALAQLPSVLPHIQSGRLRALGVASRARTPILPDLPTIAESPGLAGFESISWYSLVAPAGTPRDVVLKIQGDVARALQSPDLRERMQGLGVEPVGGSPENLAAIMRSDFDRYGAVIKRVGIKGE
jgi:tripartite-type tricarboxylate transporter receptor subunit TctC